MDGSETHSELLIMQVSVPPWIGVSECAPQPQYRTVILSFQGKIAALQHDGAASDPADESPAFRLHPQGEHAAEERGRRAPGVGLANRAAPAYSLRS
jgi:hypothetical protein